MPASSVSSSRRRVLGVAVPFHADFEEVNLRFYVRRKTDRGFRAFAENRYRVSRACRFVPRPDADLR